MQINYCSLNFFLITFFVEKAFSQGVLFPHGYFDMKKLGAIDAFYLNMLALSNLEYGGTTIEELEALSKTRFPEETINDHKNDLNEAFSNSNTNENNDEEVVKNPFRMIRKKNLKAKRDILENRKKYQSTKGEEELKEDNTFSSETTTTNDTDDPFAEIVTRAPKRPWYHYKSRSLNRHGIMTKNRYEQLKSYHKQTTTTPKPSISNKVAQKIEEYHRPFIIALPIPPTFK
uniref:Uncharacterized protein n=1 Tax=Strongyloides papillosus TaxID=174720 RepID=A0A0N5C9T1_STREA